MSAKNRANYGAEHGAAVVVGKTVEFNRRVLAAILAMVLVLTTLVVGVNIRTKAVTGDAVAIDGTYEYTYTSTITHNYEQSGKRLVESSYTASQKPQYTASITVSDGRISGVTLSLANAYSRISSPSSTLGNTTTAENDAKYYWNQGINNGIDTFLNSKSSGYYVAASNQLIGEPATYNTINSLVRRSSTGTSTLSDPNTWQQFIAMRQTLLRAIAKAPTTPTGYIENPEDYELPTPPAPPEPVENALKLMKTIAPNQSGNAYDLTLSTYSTAALNDYEVQENEPTDYILVIDQSGSMATADIPKEYKAAGNDITLEQIANGNYYYSDGVNTYRVFPVQDYVYYLMPGEYSNGKYVGYFVGDVLDDMGIDRSWFNNSEDVVSNQYANRYYYRTNDGVYHSLNTTVGGKIGAYYIKFAYTMPNGEVVLTRSTTPYYRNLLNANDIIGPDGNWFDQSIYNGINAIVGIFNWGNGEANTNTYTYSELGSVKTGMYVPYELYKQKVGYSRLVYRDNNGRIQTVPTNVSSGNSFITETEYCDVDGNAVTTAGGTTRMTYDGLLTGKDNQYATRLEALDVALKIFKRTVQNDIDSFGQVDNRIAIVGFSGHSSDGADNTEILTNTILAKEADSANGISAYQAPNYSNYVGNGRPNTNANSNGYWSFPYNVNYIGVNDADNALLKISDETQSQQIDDAIDAITAYGGTQPEDGLQLAINILESHKNDTYTKKSGADKNQEKLRKKVVVFFTDGHPGDNETSDQVKEANEVVKKANIIKTTYGAQVFSIGVFGESDLTPLTYPAHPTGALNNGIAENKNNEYDDGYFKKVVTGGTTSNPRYHYLNRYWLNTYGATDDGVTADMDTYFDYMSVISSNYPEAENFVSDTLANSRSDSTPWTTMISNEHGALNAEVADGSKNYYRLASNQESLIAAFRSAASVTQGEMVPEVGALSDFAILKDVIDTNNFDIPENATVEVKFVPGTYVENQEPNFTEENAKTLAVFNQTLAEDKQITAAWDDNESYSVRGFDFNENYIANDHPGNKMVVTIKGVTPKATGANLTSNVEGDSGIYSRNAGENEGEYTEDLVANFPVPTIARYKYELNVTDADSDAQFDLEYTLAANQGVTADFNNILISNEGLSAGTTNRERYSAGNLKHIANATNGSAIYLEYITEQGGNGTVDPADYSLTASVVPASADAGKYTYYLDTADYVDLASPDDTKRLSLEGRVETLPTTTNGNLYVDSIANNRQVTIKETVTGSFANESDTFTPTLYLVPPAGTTVPSSETYGETTWTKDGESNRLAYTPSAIRGDNSDSLILTVPVGWTLQVAQVDDNHYDVTHMEYIASTAEANVTDITTGKSFVVTDDVTVTITNTRDNIPVTGMTSSDNQTLVYILSGAGALALAAGGYYVWKKKDEFVEE